MVPESIKVFLPVSEIFPQLESNLETFVSSLRELSRTDSLFWCARLNLVVCQSDVEHLTKQQFGLNQFLTKDEIEKINDFARSDNKDAQSIVVFFRGQLLELVRWITLSSNNHPDDGLTFENPKIRRKFAQAALIASDIWSNRVFENRFSLNGGVTIARERSLGAIRKSLEGTQTVPDLSKSLGRGWILFKDYFPNNYKDFEDEFRHLTQLSIEEYYICLTSIMVNFMNPIIGAGIFNANELGEGTPFKDVLQRYIHLESQTADELKDALWGEYRYEEDGLNIPNYNYLPLREKPILRSSDGRAIILDPIFYSEKASVGPLFFLPSGKRQKAFTDFGKAFESYTCDMLKRMFPDLSVATNKRLSCNIEGTDIDGNKLEIDACLNDITEVVLFEIKTGFIREDKILADDYEDYLKHLSEKYVWSHREKGVGVGQLARTISILASKKWLGPNQEFNKVQLVYPVLLVQDSLFAAPVYGNFFAQEFKKLLAPDTELQSGILIKGQLQIAPLIIMTIDDLENLETSIQHFGFRDLLADYLQYSPDRLESLHNFIAFSDYKQYMFHNKKITATSLELFDKAKKAVFPKVNESG
ncbi:MAG: hypothetical protein GY797_31530 [Deltaproteobacteria bacterium]|nr:hypothetical protein [Deltaproteobacteria bacterium]